MHAALVPAGTATEHRRPQLPQLFVSVCGSEHTVGLAVGQARVFAPTLGAQVPFATWFVARAQLIHPVTDSGHEVLQQTLSTQNALLHWVPVVHESPVPSFGMQVAVVPVPEQKK